MPKIQWDSNPPLPLRLLGYGTPLPLPYTVTENRSFTKIHSSLLHTSGSIHWFHRLSRVEFVQECRRCADVAACLVLLCRQCNQITFTVAQPVTLKFWQSVRVFNHIPSFISLSIGNFLRFQETVFLDLLSPGTLLS